MPRIRRWFSLAVLLALLALPASPLVITQVYTEEYITLYSLGFFLDVDHSDFIGTFAAPEMNRLQANGTLYMIDHGGPGFYGTDPSMNGQQLAAFLTDSHTPAVQLVVYVGS
jgi:hypothetical protein